MIPLLITVHVLVCFIMIGVILLQAGKGAEIGAAFGGSSQTIFGSRGPGTFLSKITVGAAALFMLTSLGLSLLSGGRSVVSGINPPEDIAVEEEAAPTEEGIAVEEAPAAEDDSGILPEEQQESSPASEENTP